MSGQQVFRRSVSVLEREGGKRESKKRKETMRRVVSNRGVQGGLGGGRRGYVLGLCPDGVGFRLLLPLHGLVIQGNLNGRKEALYGGAPHRRRYQEQPGVVDGCVLGLCWGWAARAAQPPDLYAKSSYATTPGAVQKP